jgi:hypothetical protein
MHPFINLPQPLLSKPESVSLQFAKVTFAKFSTTILKAQVNKEYTRMGEGKEILCTLKFYFTNFHFTFTI